MQAMILGLFVLGLVAVTAMMGVSAAVSNVRKPRREQDWHIVIYCLIVTFLVLVRVWAAGD